MGVGDIVPKRFGLKYAPVPTLALEYEEKLNDASIELKLLIVELPEVTRYSQSQVLCSKVQKEHEYLSSKVVNQEQLDRLLLKLIQNVDVHELVEKTVIEEREFSLDDVKPKQNESQSISVADLKQHEMLKLNGKDNASEKSDGEESFDPEESFNEESFIEESLDKGAGQASKMDSTPVINSSFITSPASDEISANDSGGEENEKENTSKATSEAHEVSQHELEQPASERRTFNVGLKEPQVSSDNTPHHVYPSVVEQKPRQKKYRRPQMRQKMKKMTAIK